MYVLCTSERVAAIWKGRDTVDVEGDKTMAKQRDKLLCLVRQKNLGSLRCCKQVHMYMYVKDIQW